MKLAWLTDPHFNFVQPPRRESLYEEVLRSGAGALLLSGDIAESHDLHEYLAELAAALPMPVYFVLGNHDYYRGSVRGVRRDLQPFLATRPNLHYLSALAEPVTLAPGVSLVGHDGWGDGRLGNAQETPVMLNDFFLIEELCDLDRGALLGRLQELGDEAATHLDALLGAAAARSHEVWVVTHVPPFAGATWHEGKTSDPDWLPWFACAAAGEALRRVAAAHPACQFRVLCGHTHSAGEFAALPNLHVSTGGATYRMPRLQRLLETTPASGSGP